MSGEDKDLMGRLARESEAKTAEKKEAERKALNFRAVMNTLVLLQAREDARRAAAATLGVATVTQVALPSIPATAPEPRAVTEVAPSSEPAAARVTKHGALAAWNAATAARKARAITQAGPFSERATAPVIEQGNSAAWRVAATAREVRLISQLSTSPEPAATLVIEQGNSAAWTAAATSRDARAITQPTTSASEPAAASIYVHDDSALGDTLDDAISVLSSGSGSMRLSSENESADHTGDATVVETVGDTSLTTCRKRQGSMGVAGDAKRAKYERSGGPASGKEPSDGASPRPDGDAALEKGKSSSFDEKDHQPIGDHNFSSRMILQDTNDAVNQAAHRQPADNGFKGPVPNCPKALRNRPRQRRGPQNRRDQQQRRDLLPRRNPMHKQYPQHKHALKSQSHHSHQAHNAYQARQAVQAQLPNQAAHANTPYLAHQANQVVQAQHPMHPVHANTSYLGYQANHAVQAQRLSLAAHPTTSYGHKQTGHTSQAQLHNQAGHPRRARLPSQTDPSGQADHLNQARYPVQSDEPCQAHYTSQAHHRRPAPPLNWHHQSHPVPPPLHHHQLNQICSSPLDDASLQATPPGLDQANQAQRLRQPHPRHYSATDRAILTPQFHQALRADRMTPMGQNQLIPHSLQALQFQQPPQVHQAHQVYQPTQVHQAPQVYQPTQVHQAHQVYQPTQVHQAHQGYQPPQVHQNLQLYQPPQGHQNLQDTRFYQPLQLPQDVHPLQSVHPHQAHDDQKGLQLNQAKHPKYGLKNQRALQHRRQPLPEEPPLRARQAFGKLPGHLIFVDDPGAQVVEGLRSHLALHAPDFPPLRQAGRHSAYEPRVPRETDEAFQKRWEIVLGGSEVHSHELMQQWSYERYKRMSCCSA